MPLSLAHLPMSDRPPPQSRQNSLPSMSCITMHESVPSYSSRTRVAPSGTSRAHSASSAASRSSPTSPVPTRTSRCTRFLATLPSGTRWKNSRGPTPEGSTQANHEPCSSGGNERWKSSHVANSSGGGGTTYPNTSHQNRATRSGSVQSKVTWTCLIDDMGRHPSGASDPPPPGLIARHGSFRSCRDARCSRHDRAFRAPGSGHREVLRSALSSSPVDLLAEQVGVPGVAGVLLDHVRQQPTEAHPVWGRLLQPTAGQRLGQRVAGAVHSVDPERTQRIGGVVGRRT